jgi:hypothetical protein
MHLNVCDPDLTSSAQIFRFSPFKLSLPVESSGVFNEPRSSIWRSLPMKSEYPYNPTPGRQDERIAPPPSRFIDEKISDESGTETKSDSALAPAGLKNPFWN